MEMFGSLLSCKLMWFKKQLNTSDLLWPLVNKANLAKPVDLIQMNVLLAGACYLINLNMCSLHSRFRIVAIVSIRVIACECVSFTGLHHSKLDDRPSTIKSENGVKFYMIVCTFLGRSWD